VGPALFLGRHSANDVQADMRASRSSSSTILRASSTIVEAKLALPCKRTTTPLALARFEQIRARLASQKRLPLCDWLQQLTAKKTTILREQCVSQHGVRDRAGYEPSPISKEYPYLSAGILRGGHVQRFASMTVAVRQSTSLQP
jgi:hypothetical protein